VTAGGGKLGVVSLEKVHFTLNLLPCVWLESRSSGVEPSLVLGTLQPFSCLVAKVELEWLQPFFLLEGRNMEWMAVLTPLMGPTCHRV
jgi:hypothetical protein